MQHEAKTLPTRVASLLAKVARQVHTGDGSARPFLLLVVALLALTPGLELVAGADLLDGLQLHIEFEDNVMDSSSNSFDGQDSGDLQYGVGVIGQAAIFTWSRRWC